MTEHDSAWRGMTVDEFVETKVLPEFRPVVAVIRGLMKESAPDAREEMSYGLPMYIKKSTLAWISPSKRGVTFSFMRGVAFEDKYGLLGGDSKHARNVRMKNLDEINKPALVLHQTGGEARQRLTLRSLRMGLH